MSIIDQIRSLLNELERERKADKEKIADLILEKSISDSFDELLGVPGLSNESVLSEPIKHRNKEAGMSERIPLFDAEQDELLKKMGNAKAFLDQYILQVRIYRDMGKILPERQISCLEEAQRLSEEMEKAWSPAVMYETPERKMRRDV